MYKKTKNKKYKTMTQYIFSKIHKIVKMVNNRKENSNNRKLWYSMYLLNTYMVTVSDKIYLHWYFYAVE